MPDISFLIAMGYIKKLENIVKSSAEYIMDKDCKEYKDLVNTYNEEMKK